MQIAMPIFYLFFTLQTPTIMRSSPVIDREIFIERYKEEFGPVRLQRTINGINDLLDDLEADPLLKGDRRAIAYILATVYHETGTAMIPTAEYLQTKLDTPARRDVRRKQDRYFSGGFYGRGYNHLTWEQNYKNMSRLLKEYRPETYKDMQDGFLYKHPDLLLQQQVAYDVLVIGMLSGAQNGTGHGLFHYTDEADYVEARRTVNVLDDAKLIAGYAEKFMKIIEAASPSIVTEV